MNTLKIDVNTTIHDLSELMNKAGDSDRIRAKDIRGTVILYACNRSLLDVIKETFSTKYRQQAKDHRQLAKTTIQTILNKSDKGGRLDHALTKVSQHLAKNNHDIRPAKIRTEINELDTSKGIFKIDRDEVHLAWHASLDELVFTQRQSQPQGIDRLTEIGHMEEADKDALTALIQNANPEYAPEELANDISTLTHFMQIQGTQVSAVGTDYLRIKKLARAAYQAISNATQNKSPDKQLGESFKREPLKTAQLFFSAICNPRVTPLKIEISDPKKTTAGQRWEETMDDYMNKSSNLSKADALKTIALQNLEDRRNFPEETIKIFLPEGVSKNEMQTAFLEAQHILRNME